MTAIDRILQSYRDAAVTDRGKGTYFELLGRSFFLNGPVQAEEYEAARNWSEWANPADPLEFVQRVMTGSLRTVEIVRGLPKLEVQ